MRKLVTCAIREGLTAFPPAASVQTIAARAVSCKCLPAGGAPGAERPEREARAPDRAGGRGVTQRVILGWTHGPEGSRWHTPEEDGILVIDEHGDRKWGKHTAHVGRQGLANIGKTDNGGVSVSSLWAEEGVYWPVDLEPYAPSHHFLDGKNDAAFCTRLKIASGLVAKAVGRGLPFRAVVADSFYGAGRAQRKVATGFRRLGPAGMRGPGSPRPVRSSHPGFLPGERNVFLASPARPSSW